MKKMMRTGSLVLALVMLFMVTVAHADLLDDIREKGYIVIGTEGDWQPWTFHDENNELTGVDVEIGKAIAARLGVEAHFEETNWDAILQGVDSGRFDMACNGVGITPERQEKYTFSDPYLYTRKVLVVRSDNEDIKSFDDLNGKKTANTASSTYAQIAEEKGATVVGVDALADTIQLVLQGRVDATINSKETINDYLLVHPEVQLKVVAESEGNPVGYPVRKSEDTQTLIEAVNEALEQMRQSGELSEISTRFFNGLDLTANDEAE